jgi:hypothetical protein
MLHSAPDATFWQPFKETHPPQQFAVASPKLLLSPLYNQNHFL